MLLVFAALVRRIYGLFACWLLFVLVDRVDGEVIHWRFQVGWATILTLLVLLLWMLQPCLIMISSQATRWPADLSQAANSSNVDSCGKVKSGRLLRFCLSASFEASLFGLLSPVIPSRSLISLDKTLAFPCRSCEVTLRFSERIAMLAFRAVLVHLLAEIWNFWPLRISYWMVLVALYNPLSPKTMHLTPLFPFGFCSQVYQWETLF